MIKTQSKWGSWCSIKRKNAADEHDHLEPFEKNSAQPKTKQIGAIFPMMYVMSHSDLNALFYILPFKVDLIWIPATSPVL